MIVHFHLKALEFSMKEFTNSIWFSFYRHKPHVTDWLPDPLLETLSHLKRTRPSLAHTQGRDLFKVKVKFQIS